MKVRLVRTVLAPGRSGPYNGMYALQSALRHHQPHWLEIAEEPSETELNWFWNWEDMADILRCIDRGHPFVVGPNVLFADSGNPGGAEGEDVILSATTCRLIMCHSDWYAALLARHLGSGNEAAIVRWPYPVLPVPDGPTESQWDVLIFDKVGRAFFEIEETIGRIYPRTIVLRYGAFQRDGLVDTARRSRACVYLCEDEAGGLATAEIMQAGCPVIGIERGAPFVTRHTGVRITALDATHILSAIKAAHGFDRDLVRRAALRLFHPDGIATAVIASLDYARSQTRTRRSPVGWPVGEKSIHDVYLRPSNSVSVT